MKQNKILDDAKELIESNNQRLAVLNIMLEEALTEGDLIKVQVLSSSRSTILEYTPILKDLCVELEESLKGQT
jgi:restriction endonuclease S subunit